MTTHPRTLAPAFAGLLFLSLWSGAASAQVAHSDAQALSGDAPAVSIADQDDDDDDSILFTINEYYSIILDEDLEPEVQDKIVPLWITSVFCGAFCGALWIPMIWVGEDPGADYFAKEALFLILKEWLTTLVGGATSSFGIGAIILAASTFYLTPVGIINAYDRALKTNRARSDSADEKRGKGKKKKRKKKKAKSAQRDGASPPASAVAMAF